ncbi:MAG: hypothetical protein SFU57_02315 [Gemmatimonadales bacterium]|nr:hypothetical protein [Gemmatimonadales bacterium]
MTQRDPRDEGRPGEKEWQEFRTSFAGALLHSWLIRDLEEMRPDYHSELKQRIGDAICTIYVMREEDPDAIEGPIQGPEGSGADFWDLPSLELLENQLFPRGTSTEDILFAARGLIVVGLHAALESYFLSRFQASGRKPLYRFVEDVITRSGVTFPAALFRDLVDCDETRHLFAHSRGVVTNRYIHNVAGTQLSEGQFRPLHTTDLHRFASAIWQTAVMLRHVA